MAGIRQGSIGGIQRLIGIIDKYGEALEADLLRDGLRLRDCPSERFNWRDLYVYVKHSRVDSELFRAMFPDRHGWDKTEMLLAEAVDTLHWLQWVKTKAGQRNQDRPKQIPRPGVGPKPRPGLKPKPLPLSMLKAELAERNDADNIDKLKTILGR